MANHNFSYLELHSNDTSAAREFYKKLFDWKFEDVKVPGMEYDMLKAGEGLPGGFTKAGSAFSGWVAYVSVEDLRGHTDKARALGAKVLADSVLVPGAGRYSWLVDPAGAPVALWQPL